MNDISIEIFRKFSDIATFEKLEIVTYQKTETSLVSEEASTFISFRLIYRTGQISKTLKSSF